MTQAYHQLVKRLLDGELSLSDLPPELRAEGAEALRLLGAVDRTPVLLPLQLDARDRKSTRLNSSHDQISYAVFCLKKKKPEIRKIPSPSGRVLQHMPTSGR